MSTATSLAPLRLPSPADRPGAQVVIFDGHCRICTKQIERLVRWDSGHHLAYLSLHDPLVAERYPDLTHEELMRNLYLVDQTGRRYFGAAAFRRMALLLPRLWILAPILYLPFTLPLWQWCYQQVARRRYKLGNQVDCQDGTCHLHVR